MADPPVPPPQPVDPLPQRLGIELVAPTADPPVRWTRNWSALLADLESTGREVGAALGGLGSDADTQPTLARGWAVPQVLSHLMVGDVQAARSLRGEDPFAGEDRAHVDRMIEEQVAHAGVASAAGALEGWCTARAQLLEVAAGLPADSAFEPTAWAAGPISRLALVQSRLMETWIHAWDVLQPLGIPLALDDRSRWIADLGVRTLPYALTRAAVTADLDLEVVLSGAGGGRWSRTLGEGGTPARINGPAWAWVLLCSRRLAHDDLRERLQLDGPEDLRAVVDVARAFL